MENAIRKAPRRGIRNLGAGSSPSFYCKCCMLIFFRFLEEASLLTSILALGVRITGPYAWIQDPGRKEWLVAFRTTTD